MTKIEFYKTKSGWQGFQARGHTNFGVHGDDVVCAAVSALTQTTVVGLKKVLDLDCLVEIDEELGLLFCLLPRELTDETWNQAQLVLSVLYEGLRAIETDYGEYVTVKEVPYRENQSTAIRHKKRRR